MKEEGAEKGEEGGWVGGKRPIFIKSRSFLLCYFWKLKLPWSYKSHKPKGILF